MKRSLFASLIAAAVCSMTVFGQDIQLPAPEKAGGMPLMDALSARKSTRVFAEKEIPVQTLSSLLWAADGINRPDGRRTAPTGMNVQDIDIYVMLKSGVYKYDHKANKLVLTVSGDHRELAGWQEYSTTAPLNLFYVRDQSRSMQGEKFAMDVAVGIHAGAIMQNVYLFCASQGLGCVARMNIEMDALGKRLKLSAQQRVLLGQTIGFLKK